MTEDPVPPGSNILIEFDPASQWYNASLTIAAGWLKTGGKVSYVAQAQPPRAVRERLKTLGLNANDLEQKDDLWITDAYTAGAVGQKSQERFNIESLRVADLSIWFGREVRHEAPDPDFLIIDDNSSILDRFNEEKNWVELVLSRFLPTSKERQITQLTSIIGGGAHSVWAYKHLEAAVDGIVDFKIDESGQEARDLMRIRNMRNVGFDRKWHALRILENFEVTLER